MRVQLETSGRSETGGPNLPSGHQYQRCMHQNCYQTGESRVEPADTQRRRSPWTDTRDTPGYLACFRAPPRLSHLLVRIGGHAQNLTFTGTLRGFRLSR